MEWETLPCNQQGLIQIIQNINEYIPIRGDIDNGAGELTVDPNHLTTTGEDHQISTISTFSF